MAKVKEDSTFVASLALTEHDRQVLIDAIEEVLGDSWQRRTPFAIGLLERILAQLKEAD